MRLLSWFIFLFLIVAEGILTTLPLTLIFLLCLTVMKRQEWIFPLAFISGILLDIFAFRIIGITSLYFVSYVFLLLLYQRKYETATMPFVIIASFLGSIGYLLITGQSAAFLQAIVSTFITGSAFAVYRISNKSVTGEGFRRA